MFRQDRTQISYKCEAVAIQDKQSLIQHIQDGWEYVFMTNEEVYFRMTQMAPRKDDQPTPSP